VTIGLEKSTSTPDAKLETILVSYYDTRNQHHRLFPFSAHPRRHPTPPQGALLAFQSWQGTAPAPAPPEDPLDEEESCLEEDSCLDQETEVGGGGSRGPRVVSRPRLGAQPIRDRLPPHCGRSRAVECAILP
jgi:hypothetical protein